MCPTCRANGRVAEPLAIGTVIREEDGDIREGALVCTTPVCQREHPIIDGIPIIVADIRSFVTNQLGDLRAREDLSPFIDSALGDCAGQGSDFERSRYQLSSFARGHYADLDPDEPEAKAGGLVALLEHALSMLSVPPAGMWLDIGCAVGRTTFELAARTGELAVGVDLNFAALKMAERAARTGRVAHPQRRVGMVYDPREYEVDLPGRDKVAFWACDAMNLPFVNNGFAGVSSFNIVDCIASPLDHLGELGRVLATGGEAIITSPYDWGTSATPVEAWIGGHSQRNADHGSSMLEMRRILSDVAPASIPIDLRIVRELEEFPWRVYVHERATMHYQVHIIIARAIAAAAPL